MSTRCTIKDDRDEAAGQGFHLYEDLADERDCVMLDFKGFTEIEQRSRAIAAQESPQQGS